MLFRSIKNTIAQVASNFTTNRMLTDYLNQFYIPQSERAGELEKDDFKVAREISAWKKRINREWQNISLISKIQPNVSYNLNEDTDLKAYVVLNVGELKPQDIGVEVLLATTDSKSRLHIQETFELLPQEQGDGTVRYFADILPERAGMYQIAMRMFPKNPLLPNRQDFPLVRWI